jgi:hypothetical protein
MIIDFLSVYNIYIYIYFYIVYGFIKLFFLSENLKCVFLPLFPHFSTELFFERNPCVYCMIVVFRLTD